MSSSVEEITGNESSAEPSPRMRSTPEIGRAIRELPRREFVGFSGGLGSGAALQIPLSRIPSSVVVSAMLGALEPAPSDHLLEVGTGTGYSTAIVAKLTEQVDTVDLLAARAGRAREVLRTLGIGNVTCHVGDGLEGLESAAPFDAILVSTMVDEVPERLVDQLAEGGRMSLPLRTTRRRARLVRVRRTGADATRREVLGTVDMDSRLGDLLVDFDVLPGLYVERVADRAQASGVKLGELLVREGMLEEETLYHLLSLQHGIKFAGVMPLLHGATTEYFERLPERYLRHNKLIPLKTVGETVIVATTNPRATTAELQAVLDAPSVEAYLVTPKSFRRIWDALQSGRIDQSLREASEAEVEEASESTPTDSDDGLPDPSLYGRRLDNTYVRLFDTILFDAAAERASDVHFERYDDDVRVRFRIDGDLRDIDRYNLTPRELRGLINVIKITAGLDITERRLPQGGRFERTIDGQKIDLRVQTQPALDGEFCVIRLLPQDQDLLTIDELGFPPDIASQYRRLIQSPNGLILVVGPTGSGKSTTLYSGLQILGRDSKKKVITVEDPIEYAMDGVEQTQVHPKIGFAFDDAMRSFVRQDPDVIMVGEIRDGETALEAIRASQTGHLVLSTLHCNDSVDAVQRLFDLGMHENSIASELIGVFAQRLARRICGNCRAEATPDEEIMGELFPAGTPEDFQVYEGRGCARCGQTGTRGRVAVVEALPIGPEMRRAISARLPLDDLREEAVEAGLNPLRTNALRHVREGRIPLSEIPRILSVEAMAPPE